MTGGARNRTRATGVSDVLVLCYHAVSETWTAPLSIEPDRLERQVEELLRRGYTGATFSRAVTDPPARRTLAVTFDDAYQSVIDLALPILQRLRIPASVYVPTDFPDIGKPMSWPGIEEWLGTPHEHELIPASWNSIADLAEIGWEVGSHSCSHPRLTELDDESLSRELADSREVVEERLGRRCTTLAYPYGDVDARVVAAARDAGYREAAALPAGMHPRRPLEWPRVGIYYADRGWRFRLKASPLVRRLRGER